VRGCGLGGRGCVGPCDEQALELCDEALRAVEAEDDLWVEERGLVEEEEECVGGEGWGKGGVALELCDEALRAVEAEDDLRVEERGLVEEEEECVWEGMGGGGG
jgi:hypothetical protein